MLRRQPFKILNFTPQESRLSSYQIKNKKIRKPENLYHLSVYDNDLRLACMYEICPLAVIDNDILKILGDFVRI